MYNQHINRFFCRGIFYILLVATPVTTCCSLNAAEYYVNSNEIALFIRLEKIAEKIKKLQGTTNTKKMFSLVLDLKNEVDVYFGINLDLGAEVDRISKLLQDNGHEVPYEGMNSIKKIFKKLLKKNHKYLASSKEHKQENQLLEPPAHLVYGVTLMLVGGAILFAGIMCVNPVFTEVGKDIGYIGFGLCVESCAIESEKRRQNQK